MDADKDIKKRSTALLDQNSGLVSVKELREFIIENRADAGDYDTRYGEGFADGINGGLNALESLIAIIKKPNV